VAELLREALEPHSTTEVLDLAAEGFDPRFSPADRRAYQGTGPVPEDVLAEHDRLRRADHVVLVFPMFWWQLPAQLKGWIDRVFIEGFAFTGYSQGSLTPSLGRLTMHFVPIAATRSEPLARHGYETALRTQLQHGLVDYCGAVRGEFAVLTGVEEAVSPEALRETVDRIVTGVRASLATV
jgi:NAD(P)H dehydrogenase (quinone)